MNDPVLASTILGLARGFLHGLVSAEGDRIAACVAAVGSEDRAATTARLRLTLRDLATQAPQIATDQAGMEYLSILVGIIAIGCGARTDNPAAIRWWIDRLLDRAGDGFVARYLALEPWNRVDAGVRAGALLDAAADAIEDGAIDAASARAVEASALIALLGSTSAAIPNGPPADAGQQPLPPAEPSP